MRRPLRRLSGLLLAFICIVGAAACSLALPSHHGPPSDHFDGAQFFNPAGSGLPGFGKFLEWQLTRQRHPWPEHVEEPPQPPPPAKVEGERVRITFVGHATTLVQLGGVNLLTDPVWSEKVGPWGALGPRRVRAPGIAWEALPKIDAVVVSHAHYDHFDVETLRRLVARDGCPVYVGLGNAEFLTEQGIATGHDLDWGQSAQVGGVTIRAVPTQHWSNRSLYDSRRTLWAGFVFEGAGRRVYFGGDTGYGPHFAQTGEQLGPFDVALIPIGAYSPEWFMAPQHISPPQAVQAFRDLRAAAAIGIHWGTFELADDAFGQEVQDLARARTAAGVSEAQFGVLGFGEGREF